MKMKHAIPPMAFMLIAIAVAYADDVAIQPYPKTNLNESVKNEVCMPEVVVTASYNPLETHRTGRAITAANPEEQPTDDNALSLIEEVEGVRVKRTGADGSLSTIRLRGARSIDTKIELDGFELRDPSDLKGLRTRYSEICRHSESRAQKFSAAPLRLFMDRPRWVAS